MRLRTAVPVLTLALVVPGCGGGGGKPTVITRPPTTASTTSTTIAAGTPAPLTGLPVTAEEASRAAVVVKVDNSPDGRPQSGIDRADVLIEEKVEGTVTRFLAVFQSQDASYVGPIRSVRSTDPPLLTPIGGVFAYSGGVPRFVSEVRKAGVTAISEMDHGDAFLLRADRHRPYKTYGATTSLRKFASDDADPPKAMFGFRDEGEDGLGSSATPATHVSLVFGSRTTATWDYDAAKDLWLRTTNGTPHVLDRGGRIAVTNLVIQYVGYRSTGVRDPSGTEVDQAMVTGSGDCVIFSGGRQVKGRWSKASASSVTTYTDAGGRPIELTPGTTWVGLPPLGATTTAGPGAGMAGSTTTVRP